MKKNILFFIILCFVFKTSIVLANTKYTVSLYKCVDGDTAYFKLNEDIIKTRFLAIDTPESTNKIEPYGKEASAFTCDALKKAKKIVIEYDDNSNKKDKYNRDLVWVWVDNKLLQKELLDQGLAEVKYLYGNYEYTDQLKVSEDIAKSKKLNMWSNNNTSDESLTYQDYILIILTIIMILISKDIKKKLRKKRKK